MYKYHFYVRHMAIGLHLTVHLTSNIMIALSNISERIYYLITTFYIDADSTTQYIYRPFSQLLSIAILVLYYIFLSFPYPSHRKIEMTGGIRLLKNLETMKRAGILKERPGEVKSERVKTLS